MLNRLHIAALFVIGAALPAQAQLRATRSLTLEGAKNIELSQKNSTRRVGANIDLRPTRDLSLATLFSRTWMRDNPHTSDNDNDDLSVELSQNFRLLRNATQRPSGRIFFRYQRQSASTAAFIDAVRGDPDLRRSWALNSGVSLNAF